MRALLGVGQLGMVSPGRCEATTDFRNPCSCSMSHSRASDILRRELALAVL